MMAEILYIAVSNVYFYVAVSDVYFYVAVSDVYLYKFGCEGRPTYNSLLLN